MPRMRFRVSKIDYPSHLESMWEKARAPRNDNAPTVISTFAGGGGSLSGYMMAGFNDLLAIEWDKNAVDVLRANWPTLDVYHGDIAKLSVDSILERTELKPGQLDVLDGSPPYQGFSTAGKRQIDDPRNTLFKEYARLLKGLQPKVFVMENVSGMVKGKMKLLFVEILKELKSCGYDVSARLLNAMYFHVPQSRERLIFIGVRNDLGIKPSHPGAESSPISANDAFLGINHVMMNESFAARPLQIKDSITLTKTPPTLVKQAGSIRGKCVVHPSGRHLSIGEAKRISSFSDGYAFIGSFNKRWARIGNSVPPLFMEAIARHIRVSILDKTK